MSLDYLNAAFKSNISRSSAKFVMVALADYASENGLAFPSIQTICHKTSLNRKTVLEQLRYLESLGLIADTGSRCGKTKSVKIYQLDLTGLSKPENGTGLSGSENGTASVTSKPENGTSKAVSKPKNGTSKQSQKRDTEPSVTNHQNNNHQSYDDDGRSLFEVDANWQPDLPQTSLDMLKVRGLTQPIMKDALIAFKLHHATQRTKRNSHQWTQSFTHYLSKRLPGFNNESIKRTNKQLGQSDTDSDKDSTWTEEPYPFQHA